MADKAMNFIMLPKILPITKLCGLCFIYLLKFISFSTFRVVRVLHFETLRSKPTSINVAVLGIFEVIFDKFNAGVTLVTSVSSLK